MTHEIIISGFGGQGVMAIGKTMVEAGMEEGLSLIHIYRLPAAMLAFVLNYSAYFCEIFRGGMLSIDPGQYEAARVLGFSKKQTLLQIILPQMLRVSLPSIANEAITLVKDCLLYTSGPRKNHRSPAFELLPTRSVEQLKVAPVF